VKVIKLLLILMNPENRFFVCLCISRFANFLQSISSEALKNYFYFLLQPLVATHPPEIRLPNAPDYPGLQYPPIFEPGSYSLSDVSNLLRSSRVRSFDHGDEAMSNSENFDLGLEPRMGESVNNNHTPGGYDRDENQNQNSADDNVIEYSFTTV